MPELRKDPIVGRWVIVATERARRPGNFVDSFRTEDSSQEKADCPYCHKPEKIIYATTLDGKSSKKKWDVCVVPFRSSFLGEEGDFEREKRGLYHVIHGHGIHEVIIESPDHIANMADLSREQISCVLKTYALRIEELKKDKNFRYVIAFKNFGASAGSRKIEHARSHIIATPITPLRIKEKLQGALEYFKAHHTCIYCDLMEQERATKERVVVETEHFLAITPFAARFLFEIWIIPKKHHCNFVDGIKGLEDDLANLLKILLAKFKGGLDDPSYNYIIQTAPFYHNQNKNGAQRWQTIEQDFHWHIELMPRLTQIAGFEKGTGFYINSIAPEMTAEYLRGI